MKSVVVTTGVVVFVAFGVVDAFVEVGIGVVV